ncbi:hypothetical protein ACFCV3_06410 [Kribbella sp. NPDC056345]|uniref:hypothetical protein n=1 Tax=Kribbella sp. NPDC056345 TaxID=3345789 RepID=UPI0035DCE935
MSTSERSLRPPSTAMRVFLLCMIAVFTLRAIVRPDLESILTAALFLVLLLPDVIAPTRYRPWASAIERDRPVLGSALVILLVGCAAFLLLRFFLDRTPSALIAAALAVVAVVVSLIGRSRRTRERVRRLVESCLLGLGGAHEEVGDED